MARTEKERQKEYNGQSLSYQWIRFIFCLLPKTHKGARLGQTSEGPEHRLTL